MTSILMDRTIDHCPNCNSDDIDHDFDDLDGIDWWCLTCDWEGYTAISCVDLTLDPVVTTTPGTPVDEVDPGPLLPGFDDAA